MRKKISGTSDRPRISVFISNKHFYAQAIDDEKEVTLAQCSDFSLGKSKKKGITVKTAERIGTKMADILKKGKISQVVLDRSGYKYHGRVKAFTEALRKGGITL
jgi:large subunit ribosomal protein L18